MLRARAEPAELPGPQDAPHGTLGNLNVKAAFDLDFEIAAAPAYHAILDGVRRGLRKPVQLRELSFVKTGLAAWARAVLEPLDTFRVEAVHPVPKRLPLHASASCRICAAGPVQDLRDCKKPAGLVRIGRNASHVPQLRGRMVQARDLNGHAIPPAESVLGVRESHRPGLGNPQRRSQNL